MANEDGITITKATFADDEITLHPARWAHYDADMRGMVERREVVGPNTLGEHLVAVEAVYDEDLNKTSVGFAFLPKVKAAV